MDKPNIHKGHRSRMKKAVLEDGLDGLNDHQVLEVLLFYSIPRVDTNPLAHTLIDRFGSLRGVLEAEYDELLAVDGVTENTASLIKFSQTFAGRYLRSASFEDNKTLRFTDTDALRRYYEGVFLGAKDEQVRAMAVDDDLCMIKEKLIMEGTIGKVEITARKIADFAIKSHSNRIILAHNHPNGSAMPSRADLAATTEFAKILNTIEIELLDHIIVGKTGSFSLRASHSAKIVWPSRFDRFKGGQ